MSRFIAPCGVLFLFACSSTTPGTDAGADASPMMEAGPQDAGVVNSCTAFTAATGGTPTVTGPSTGAPAQYTPNCLQIAVGQSVVFNSDFTAHPLEAFGGSTPNPITTTSSGTTVTFAFPNAGTFGFHCQAHPGIMFGAIEVTQ